MESTVITYTFFNEKKQQINRSVQKNKFKKLKNSQQCKNVQKNKISKISLYENQLIKSSQHIVYILIQ